MIVNSSIQTGFLKVKIVGMYFGLVSCSGIVKVTLWNAGTPVLESKMWVGMNLPQAIPYDEIQMESEVDQPVEFWAGKAPMTQNINSFKGASAIRTSVIHVLGNAAITGSDLLRQSVRLRANKDIFVGGAGVNGTGWRVPANTVEDVPVSGVLHAYLPIPELDFDLTTDGGVVADMWQDQGNNFTNFIHISEDEQTLLQVFGSTDPRAYLKQGVGAWENVSTFTGIATFDGYLKSKIRNEIFKFVKRGTAWVTAYKSVDDGKTFKEVKNLIANDFYPNNIGTASGNWNSGFSVGIYYGQSCGRYISYFNTQSLEYKGRYKDDIDDTFGYYVSPNLVLTEPESFTGFEVTSGIKNSTGLSGSLRRITNGVASSEVILSGCSSLTIDETGRYLAMKKGNKCILSIDGGDTWALASIAQPYIHSLQLEYLINGMWLTYYGGKLYLLYVLDGKTEVRLVSTLAGTPANDRAIITVLNSGAIYRAPLSGSFNQQSGVRFDLNIAGDLSPAQVEVMELLS